MLTLNRLSDYAIVLISRLTAHAGDQASARALAAETGIPVPTVVKVLKLLASHGALESIQGRKGGYRLARPATGISLVEVIEAIEGPFALTQCNRPDSACRIEAACGVHKHWLLINAAIRETLAHLSVADLAGPAAALRSWGSIPRPVDVPLPASPPGPIIEQP
jgi:FeS assembly SUF system regulator